MIDERTAAWEIDGVYVTLKEHGEPPVNFRLGIIAKNHAEALDKLATHITKLGGTEYNITKLERVSILDIH